MNRLWDIRIFLGLVPKESHCTTQWIWNSFDAFVMESCYYTKEIAVTHFMSDRVNGSSREALHLYSGSCPQRRVQSHKLLTKLISDWVNPGSLFHGCRNVEAFDQFELSRCKFSYSEEWIKFPDPLSEEMQLLRLSVFHSSGEFRTNSNVPVLPIIVQGWCFASGFSQNVL